jgi:hypothetical protein
MPTRSYKGKRSANRQEDKDKNGAIVILPVEKGAPLKAIYAAAQKAFTAADLQKYTEIEEGIPARQVLAELEAVDRKQSQINRTAKNGRSR